MSIRKLLSIMLAMAVLSMLAVLAKAQMTDQAAREQARKSVRSQLHLRSDQFLSVQRDEALEQMLAAMASPLSGPEFIYRVSQEGDEIKEATKASPTGHEVRGNTVVHHIVMDGDPTQIIAIRSADGTIYRIHGFGQSESLAEFNKLMTAAKVTVSSPEQAESLAEFYRAVNPQNMQLTPISSVIELKQAAERQCQSGAKSFQAGEKVFTAWWKHMEPLSANVPLNETAIPSGGGYLVEWTVLSSPGSGGLCGGTPLRARLEVNADGHVNEPTFSSTLRGRYSHSGGKKKLSGRSEG